MPIRPESLVETGSPHNPNIMNNQEPTVAPSMLKQVNKAALEEVRESTESANAKMHMSFGMMQQNMLANSGGKNGQNQNKIDRAGSIDSVGDFGKNTSGSSNAGPGAPLLGSIPEAEDRAEQTTVVRDSAPRRSYQQSNDSAANFHASLKKELTKIEEETHEFNRDSQDK